MSTPIPSLNDSDMVTWSPRDEQKLRRNLDALLDVMVVEDGKVVSHEAFRVDAILFILGSLVRIRGVDDDRLRHRLITATAFRLLLFRRRDLWGFRRALAGAARRHLSSPLSVYQIVFPLNIDPRCLAGRRSITAGGVRFSIQTWGALRENLSLDSFMGEIQVLPATDPRLLHRSFTPLLAVHEGSDHTDAYNAVHSGFHLLRSALNLEVFHRYSLQLGRPNPLGKVWIPPVTGIFDSAGDLANYYYEDSPPHSYRLPNLADATVERAVQLLRELGRPRAPRAVMGLVEDAIRKYGKAVDTTTWSEAFLSLWQVLELLTHDPDGRYSMDDVCRRAKVLLRQHPLLTDLLDTCYVVRNRLVHAGRFADEGLKEVGMLKRVVEACIDATYGLRRVCRTRESLFAYYRFAAASNHDLEMQSKVISHIRRNR